jgi:hypothetical protein
MSLFSGYGPESPVYEFLQTEGIVIWSRKQPARQIN